MLIFRPKAQLERDASLVELTELVEESVHLEGEGLHQILKKFPARKHQAYRLGRAYLACLEADNEGLPNDDAAAGAYEDCLDAMLDIALEGQEVAFIAYSHALSLVSNMLPSDYLAEQMTIVLESSKPNVQLFMELLVICDGDEELRLFERRVYGKAIGCFPAEFKDWYDESTLGPEGA